MDDEKICALCKFWWFEEARDGHPYLSNDCRRHAPRPTADSSRWPRTEWHDWCGEHEPAEDALDRVTAFEVYR